MNLSESILEAKEAQSNPSKGETNHPKPEEIKENVSNPSKKLEMTSRTLKGDELNKAQEQIDLHESDSF